MGFVWSVVLWHQQVITERRTKEDQERIVATAVTQSNQHSDQQIGAVRSDVRGVKTDMQDVKKDLETKISDTISKSTSTLSESIGKVNKPIPQELARLQFRIFVEGILADDPPILRTSLNEDTNGNVTVGVFFRNVSGTAAEMVDVWINVCNSCSFAVEPSGFERPAGIDEHMRHMTVPVLNSGAASQKFTLVVKPPPPPTVFTIGFLYSCKACGKMSETQKLMISVLPKP